MCLQNFHESTPMLGSRASGSGHRTPHCRRTSLHGCQFVNEAGALDGLERLAWSKTCLNKESNTKTEEIMGLRAVCVVDNKPSSTASAWCSSSCITSFLFYC
jgi:hypothetical protein